MINVRDFLKCVNNEVEFEVKGNSFTSKQLYEQYTIDELFYLKIIHIYVNPNDTITAVIHFD